MRPSSCFHCLNGDPQLCTGVDCYRCDCGCATRRHGQTATERQPGYPDPANYRAEVPL